MLGNVLVILLGMAKSAVSMTDAVAHQWGVLGGGLSLYSLDVMDELRDAEEGTVDTGVLELLGKISLVELL